MRRASRRQPDVERFHVGLTPRRSPYFVSGVVAAGGVEEGAGIERRATQLPMK